MGKDSKAFANFFPSSRRENQTWADFFPSSRRQKTAHPKPSPRQQALKDRLAVLVNNAGIERVGGHWDVWYNGCTAECANLTEATWVVEGYEQQVTNNER